MDEFFGGVDRGLVHHFHAAGNDARADDARDAIAGILDALETDQQGARSFGLFQDADGDFGDHAEQAFGAGDDAQEVIAAGIKMLAAEPDDLAGDEHNLNTENVVGRHAVFEAMHATGILRYVAADAAGDLRRRIGRVIESGVRDGAADGEIGDSGFGHHHTIGKIDFADAVELGQAEQHAVPQRECAAGERGAGAARHHFDSSSVAIAQHIGNLLGGLGQHHHHGHLAVGRERIRFKGFHRGLDRDDALTRDDGAQCVHNFGAAREHGLIEFGHLQGHMEFLGCFLGCFPIQFEIDYTIAVVVQ